MSLRNQLLIFIVLIGSTAGGQGIYRSHHDFTGSVWNSSQPCSPCHLPKISAKDSSISPLWNLHKTEFDYASFSILIDGNNPGQPGGKSKLCLSCHDGTVAKERHVGKDVSFALPENGFASEGSAKEHPVSIPYDTSRSYKVLLNNPVTTMSGLGRTIEQDLLENGNIECTSCHDVHVSRNTQGCIGCHINGITSLSGSNSLSLRKTNDYSALCITCHQK